MRYACMQRLQTYNLGGMGCSIGVVAVSMVRDTSLLVCLVLLSCLIESDRVLVHCSRLYYIFIRLLLGLY